MVCVTYNIYPVPFLLHFLIWPTEQQIQSTFDRSPTLRAEVSDFDCRLLQMLFSFGQCHFRFSPTCYSGAPLLSVPCPKHRSSCRQGGCLMCHALHSKGSFGSRIRQHLTRQEVSPSEAHTEIRIHDRYCSDMFH